MKAGGGNTLCLSWNEYWGSKQWNVITKKDTRFNHLIQGFTIVANYQMLIHNLSRVKGFLELATLGHDLILKLGNIAIMPLNRRGSLQAVMCLIVMRQQHQQNYKQEGKYKA